MLADGAGGVAAGFVNCGVASHVGRRQRPPDGAPGRRQGVIVPGAVFVVAADDDYACRHHQFQFSITPAMVAVISVATEPPSTARMPKRAMSCRRSGASEPMPPIWMAMEAKLAKPHSA